MRSARSRTTRRFDPAGGLHHASFYGFMLCFASTSVATLYHYLLGLEAPYALTSLPVLLGTAGGIGLAVGPAGLLWLNLRRDPQHGRRAKAARRLTPPPDYRNSLYTGLSVSSQ